MFRILSLANQKIFKNLSKSFSVKRTVCIPQRKMSTDFVIYWLVYDVKRVVGRTVTDKLGERFDLTSPESRIKSEGSREQQIVGEKELETGWPECSSVLSTSCSVCVCSDVTLQYHGGQYLPDSFSRSTSRRYSGPVRRRQSGSCLGGVHRMSTESHQPVPSMARWIADQQRLCRDPRCCLRDRVNRLQCRTALLNRRLALILLPVYAF